jgi:hypothetical protein
MDIHILKIAGGDAIRALNEHRSQYPATGLYPFLIGDAGELEQITEAAKFNERDPAAIIAASHCVSIADWIARRRAEWDEDEFDSDAPLGDWPGELSQKDSIGLHKDLSGEIKLEVHIGLVKLETPWHLPALLRYGGWNGCPEPEVHCAFHREWQVRFGAEITGMSGDVIECLVAKPPTEREAATALAWEQFWYCNDIVDPCRNSISSLAATQLNSPYWSFWWD